MANKDYRDFDASFRPALDLATTRAADASGERVIVSIYLKPHAQEPSLDERMSRSDLRAKREQEYAAEITAVTRFAADASLAVVAIEPARRLVKLAGTAAQLEQAFKTRLSNASQGAWTFRVRSGALQLPADLLPIVEAVLGLDTRPVAAPRLVMRAHASLESSFWPTEIARLYDFPTELTGAGECIALIELGGGFTTSDTRKAFETMGLAPPAVTAVGIDGAVNRPRPDDGADGEVALDIQVAGGAAPGARIAVYFAPNTDAGFVDAISAAAHDLHHAPSVLSISWGSAEVNWTQQAIDAMNSAFKDASALGVSVFCASGDNLATDGVSDGRAHVDFPASSPWAIGCGGTFIQVDHGAIAKETAWNDGRSGTGGGISEINAVPAFQRHVRLPANVNRSAFAGRGVPDVAAVGAPASGYRIVINGATQVVGGTSAVAPLWAALIALINERAPARAGFFLTTLYANAKVLRSITLGNNKASGSALGYDTGAGWNACTGLGVPGGRALCALLNRKIATTRADP